MVTRFVRPNVTARPFKGRAAVMNVSGGQGSPSSNGRLVKPPGRNAGPGKSVWHGKLRRGGCCVLSNSGDFMKTTFSIIVLALLSVPAHAQYRCHGDPVC